jgi:uncharacterized protein
MLRKSIAALFLISGATHSASFDCTKATSKVEKLICSTPALSQADDALYVDYLQAKLITGNSADFKALIKQNWKMREKNCETEECLLNWYKKSTELYKQIASTSNSSDVQPRQEKLTTIKQPPEVTFDSLPEPQNMTAFNNFKVIISDFFIKSEIESAKSGKESKAFKDVSGSYSSVQLYREYKQNELVANKKYKGKKIRVHGVTESVTENFIGQAMVKTESPDFFLGGTMYKVNKEDPYILSLVPGSKVDMVCTGAGFVMDSPILKNCVSTDSYIESQIRKSSKFPNALNAMTYLFYMPNEDILGKACHTLTSCSELVSAFKIFKEYTNNEDNIPENEKKKITDLFNTYGITAELIKERVEKTEKFIEQNKTESFRKKFNLDSKSK